MKTDINLDSDKDSEIAEIRGIVEENQKILKSLQNRARFSTVITALKWIFIIGISIGAYTLVQPFLEQMLDTYKSIQESTSALGEIRNSIPDTSGINIPELLKQFTE